MIRRKARSIAGVIFWLAASACAEPLTVIVKAEQDLGALSPLWRPSIMISWPDSPALDKLFGLPGNLGAVRYTFEPTIQDQTREAAFFDELNRRKTDIAHLAARDAQILISFTRMPAWLSSRQSTRREPAYGYMEREGVVPKSQAAYRDFAQRVSSLLAPLAPGRLWYEGWNEPDADGFWKGTRTELFDTWASFADGVRAGDPEARVGSPCVSSWSTTRPAPDRSGASPPLLEDFMHVATARAGRRGAALDFVCWHNFGKTPGVEWWGAASLREWAKAAGLPAALPQVVSEWNLWATAPQEADPGRDGARGAAFLATALHEMERAGVSWQTPAVLQDFRASGKDNPFHGDFGLMTRGVVVEKAAFKLLAMQSQLLTRRLVAEVSDRELADAQSVHALATGNGRGELAVLISRYHGDARGSFARSLYHQGYPFGRGLTVWGDKLEAFIEGRRELAPGEAGAREVTALQKARRVARASLGAADRIPLRLEVLNAAGQRMQRWSWRLFVIDSQHLNPEAVFRTARASGATAAQAIAAAQAVGFTPMQRGTGSIPELMLEPHAVALLLLRLGDAP